MKQCYGLYVFLYSYGLNIESYSSHVCVYQSCSQTLAGICRNMSICDVFSTVGARENRPSFLAQPWWGSLCLGLCKETMKQSSILVNTVPLTWSIMLCRWQAARHIHVCNGIRRHINPLPAKFFKGKKNLYLHFMSFLHTDMTQVVEILPQVRQDITYSA